MTEFIVTKKQSLVDMCLQLYGSTEFLFKLSKDNGIRLDANIAPGQKLMYDETIGSKRVLNHITRNNLRMINPIPIEGPPQISTGWTDGIGAPFTDGLGVQFTFET